MSVRLYDDLNLTNEEKKNYKVIITGLRTVNGGSALPVTGSLASDFALAGGNDFTSAGEVLRDIPLVGSAIAIKDKFSGLVRLSGRSATTELETRKVWNNSLIPDIPIEMEFYQTSVNLESIMEKIKRLKSAVYPTRKGGYFKAPLGYKFTGRKDLVASGTLTLQIGTWFRATGLVMTSENVTFSKEVNVKGHPLSAKVSITFQPFKSITYDEFLAYFRN